MKFFPRQNLFLFLKEKRLPSIISLHFKHIIFVRLFWNVILRFALRFTRRIPSNPQSKTELHCVVGQEQVVIGIFAVKSFLRFYQDVRVVIHGDGTPGQKNIVLLKEHIPGVQVITRDAADEEIGKLLPHKYCLMARAMIPEFMQPFDYFIFSQGDKIIGLDSDTLFFGYPKEVIDWIQADTNTSLYAYEKSSGLGIFNPDGGKKAPNGNTSSVLLQGVNGGLFCCQRWITNFDLAEAYLKFLTENNYPVESFYAQNITGLFMRDSGIPYKALPPSDYKVMINYGFPSGDKSFRSLSVFKHYSFNNFRHNLKFGYPRGLYTIFKELLR